MKPKNFSLMIGGHKVKVKFIANMPKNTLGDYDAMTKTIRICAFLEDHIPTLIHEVFHAALDITGHTDKMEIGEEEAFVKALEHAFSPMVKSLLKKLS
jgi:hypothetical protein